MNNFVSPSILIPTKDKNTKIINIPFRRNYSLSFPSIHCIEENNGSRRSPESISNTDLIEKNLSSIISKSFEPYEMRKKHNCTDFSEIYNNIRNTPFNIYDAINNCKSAGIIPYTIHNGELYFFLQKNIYPCKKKDKGWNDFGGKKNSLFESTYETAAREFSEETSCIFYLNEKNDDWSKCLYHSLIKNRGLVYDDNTILKLNEIIPESQKYFSDKINEFVIPMYISSKETYISYFVRVNYIPEKYFPISEDLHIHYEDRYIRKCAWISIEQILNMKEKDFHRRLQITKIQQRIKKYYDKEMFT